MTNFPHICSTPNCTGKMVWDFNAQSGQFFIRYVKNYDHELITIPKSVTADFEQMPQSEYAKSMTDYMLDKMSDEDDEYYCRNKD